MAVLSRSVMSNSLRPHGLYVPYQAPLSLGILQARIRVGLHNLLQGIFPTQGSNPGLLHGTWTLYRLTHQGSPQSPLPSRDAMQNVIPGTHRLGPWWVSPEILFRFRPPTSGARRRPCSS